MTSDQDKERRAVLVGIIVGMGTLFGVAAYNNWLDDIGRVVMSFFK